MKLKTYLDAIDREETGGMVAKLIAAGFDRDEIKEVLPGLLDELIDFSILIPGPAGAAAEAIDRQLFKAVIDAIFPIIWKKAERKAKARVAATVKVS